MFRRGNINEKSNFFFELSTLQLLSYSDGQANQLLVHLEMSIPTTPIPHADLEPTSGKRKDTRLSVASQSLQTIYLKTFSFTGDQYLRETVQQVASATKAELVLILQTVPKEEYFKQNQHHVFDSVDNGSGRQHATLMTDNAYPSFFVNKKPDNGKQPLKEQYVHIVRYAYTSSSPSNCTQVLLVLFA